MDTKSYPMISTVRRLRQEDPRATKSGGVLSVLFQFDFRDVLRFMDHDGDELAKLGWGIRGLRSYTVSDLPAGKVGGTEFHRVRQEVIFTLRGNVAWDLEDVYGNTDQFHSGVGGGL